MPNPDLWPIGVFTSVDAGFGVHLEVAHELGVPTVQVHAPRLATRTADTANQYLDRLQAFGIRLTCKPKERP